MWLILLQPNCKNFRCHYSSNLSFRCFLYNVFFNNSEVVGQIQTIFYSCPKWHLPLFQQGNQPLRLSRRQWNKQIVRFPCLAEASRRFCLFVPVWKVIEHGTDRQSRLMFTVVAAFLLFCYQCSLNLISLFSTELIYFLSSSLLFTLFSFYFLLFLIS